MRRDLYLALSVSLLVHAGFAALGKGSPPPIKAPATKDAGVIMTMPPLDPDPPEVVDRDKEQLPDLQVAPPTLPEVPVLARPDSFTQPVQPPPPDGIKVNTGVITIPQGRPTGSRGEIFELKNLDRQPTVSYQASPTYPFEMRHNGTTGQVVVGFIVDARGSVVSPYVVSSTQREFESAALQAVGKWKFRPGQKAGVAVSTRMQVPIVFSISQDQ